MTSLLVTGASGFIGQRVVRAARSSGHRVLTLARRAGEGVDIVCDLRGPMRDVPPTDWVVHLAGGYAGASYQELEDVDFTAARNLLAWARKTGVRNFAFAGAAEVYGAVAGLAAEDAPTQPVIPYGQIKLRIEHLLRQFASEVAGSRVAVLRIGEVYGVQGRLIQELSRRLRSGFCPWFGSGAVPLSFVQVDDVSQAFMYAIAGMGVGFGVWNVADDVPTTWRTFLRALAEGLGTRPPVGLPLPLAYSYAAAAMLVARLRGLPPVVTPRIVRLLTTPKPLSNARLRQRLGFEPLYPDYRHGLREVLHGLSHNARNRSTQRGASA